MNVPVLRDAVYFADGALRGGTLDEDTDVDGVPCKGGEKIKLHENGRLESAWLAADVTVGGVPCAADAPIDFYPSGALKWARLARPHRVGEVPCAQGSPIFFHPNGVLWNGELGDRWRRDGRVVSAVVVHREDGVRYKRRVYGRIVPGQATASPQ
jgi:hypothetical protein